MEPARRKSKDSFRCKCLHNYFCCRILSCLTRPAPATPRERHRATSLQWSWPQKVARTRPDSTKASKRPRPVEGSQATPSGGQGFGRVGLFHSSENSRILCQGDACRVRGCLLHSWIPWFHRPPSYLESRVSGHPGGWAIPWRSPTPCPPTLADDQHLW